MPLAHARAWCLAPLAGLLLAAAGCDPTPAEPLDPTWSDAAPILRGDCNGCHGYAAPTTGGGYRFDFFDATPAVCGDAALAMGSNVILAGSALAASQMERDVVAQPGETWPRMPPQPTPALPDWERDTLERWSALPVKGPPPPNNRPPNIQGTGYPVTADATLAFTAVLDDPDGDSAIGVIEANGFAYLMNRPGSFAVGFDTSSWPAGPVTLTAVVCDGWASATLPLGTVQIEH